MAELSLRHIYKVYPARTGANSKKDKGQGETAAERRHGDFTAVKDFNMEISDGEFIVFVGPSGCGKSTTLRMIAGLEPISAGELYIDNRLMNNVEPKDRDIAMVFQSYALYPHMTAYQNIAFGLKMRRIPVAKVDREGNPVTGIDKRKIREIRRKLRELEVSSRQVQDAVYLAGMEAQKKNLTDDLHYYETTPVQLYSYHHMPADQIDERVKWAASILGIEELLDSKPAEMSGGQRQRIALGRSIVRHPKVMLLDEPLSNLDAKLRTAMRAEIVKIHQRLKTTFIYVTHDQIEAMTMGTRIVVMKGGVIQQIDTPTNLFDYPVNKFVAGFIGTPQMNFFDVTVRREGKNLTALFPGNSTASYPLDELRTIRPEYLDGEAHRAILGVRAENMSLSPDCGIPATLSLKEVLGNTTQLFVRLTDDGADSIICVTERNDLRPGDRLFVQASPKHIHLFDSETEESLMERTYGNPDGGKS